MKGSLPDRPGFFITGTDTGVGKTTVAVGLMHCLQAQGRSVAALKPVASGCLETAQGLRNDDALVLQRQASVDLAYEQVNPYAFEPAIAPHIAAARAGVRIDPEPILETFRSMASRVDCVVVEGAGGWQVPLDGRYGMAELAKQMQLPVILVVGMRLGCLNHARLAADAIVADGLTLAGWVANCPGQSMDAFEENLNTLKTIMNAPLLGLVPALPEVTAEAVAACLSGFAADVRI